MNFYLKNAILPSASPFFLKVSGDLFASCNLLGGFMGDVSVCVCVSVCACDISWKRMQRARTKVRRIRFSTIKYFISHPRDTGRNLIKKFSSIEETPSNGCRSTPPPEGQGDPHRRSRSSQRPPGRPRAAPLRMRIPAPCARAPARRGDNLAGSPGASELPGPERCFNEFVLH